MDTVSMVSLATPFILSCSSKHCGPCSTPNTMLVRRGANVAVALCPGTVLMRGVESAGGLGGAVGKRARASEGEGARASEGA